MEDARQKISEWELKTDLPELIRPVFDIVGISRPGAAGKFANGRSRGRVSVRNEFQVAMKFLSFCVGGASL